MNLQLNFPPMNTLTWFTDRIGKRIYRAATSCPCEGCKKLTQEGLVVQDRDHAHALHDYSREMDIRYYDEPQGI